jgi:hypothetical protein
MRTFCFRDAAVSASTEARCWQTMGAYCRKAYAPTARASFAEIFQSYLDAFIERKPLAIGTELLAVGTPAEKLADHA